MFDILVYLFETYAPHAQPGAFPAPGVLMRKLSAVGFEQEEISAALEWLAGLESPAAIDGSILPALLSPGQGQDSKHPRQPRPAQGKAAARIYCSREASRLPVECRGYLGFLEETGVIDAGLREMIIERAMALRDTRVMLDRLKIIVLMVLWRRQPTMEGLDGLLLEELLSAENDRTILH